MTYIDEAPCDPCDTCAGEGSIEVDEADGRGEHVSRSYPCPDCDGDGKAPPEPDDEDDAPAAREVAWEAPE